MKKIVFVCQVFYPDQQATSQLVSDLLTSLTLKGFDIEVLTGFPSGPKLGETARVETWRRVRIKRGGVRVDSKRSLASRAISYLAYTVWVTWLLLFRTPADAVVMASTNPPFAPIIVRVLHCCRRWRYQVMLHDLYPDGLVVLGGIASGSMVVKFWSALNSWSFRNAERVVVLGRDMADLCHKRYRVERSKLAIVPNWSPVEQRWKRSPEETDLWRILGLEGYFVVQYSGNMGLWHDMDSIVRAAAQLGDKDKVRFLMIGNGRRRTAAQELCASLKLKNMIWMVPKDTSELADTLGCCHAALISLRPNLGGIAVPSKLYGILASGRAIIAQVPADSEVAYVVHEEACGFVTAPGDVAELVSCIRRLALDRATALAMGNRALEAYRTKYTKEMAIERLESVLSESFYKIGRDRGRDFQPAERS